MMGLSSGMKSLQAFVAFSRLLLFAKLVGFQGAGGRNLEIEFSFYLILFC